MPTFGIITNNISSTKFIKFHLANDTLANDPEYIIHNKFSDAIHKKDMDIQWKELMNLIKR